jgi:histidine triad (HIT) family protein
MGCIYTLARNLGPGIAFILEYFPVLVPTRLIIETETLLAFEHPNPAFPVHILIVPRRSIASLSDLDASDDALLGEVLGVVKRLIGLLSLEACGYRLILNGGKYQEFPQLHFHLVSDGTRQPE